MTTTSESGVSRFQSQEVAGAVKVPGSERRLDIVDYLRICRAIGLDPGKPLRSVNFGKPARK